MAKDRIQITATLKDDASPKMSKLSMSVVALNQGLQLAKSAMSAVAAPFKAVVSTGMDFEHQMSAVAAISGEANARLGELTEVAKELGAASVFSSQEAGAAMEELVRAGMSVDDVISTAGHAMNLAAASGTGLANAAQVMAVHMGNFAESGISAEEMADLMNQTIAASPQNFQNLQQALKTSGPMAASLGISFKDLTVVLGSLAKTGFKGEMAGTMLQSAIARLAKPTKEASTVLEELGLTIEDVNPATNNLKDIFRKLEMTGMDTKQMVTLFGQEMGLKFKKFIDNASSSMAEFTEAQEGANTAAESASIAQNNLKGDLKGVANKLEALMLDIYEPMKPLLRQVTQAFGDFVQVIIDFVKNNKEEIGAFFKGVGTVIMGMWEALKFVWDILKKLEPVLDAQIKIWKAGWQIFKKVWEFEKKLFQTYSDIFEKIMSSGPVINQFFQDLMDIVKKFNPILDFFKSVWELLGAAFSLAVAWLDKIIQPTEKIQTGMSLLGEGLKLVSEWGNKVLDFLKPFFDQLTSLIPGVETLKSVFSSVMDSFKTGTNWINKVTDALKAQEHQIIGGSNVPALKKLREEEDLNTEAGMRRAKEINEQIKALIAKEKNDAAAEKAMHKQIKVYRKLSKEMNKISATDGPAMMDLLYEIKQVSDEGLKASLLNDFDMKQQEGFLQNWMDEEKAVQEEIRKEYENLQWAKQSSLDAQWNEEQRVIAERNKEYANEAEEMRKEWAALQWAKLTAAKSSWEQEEQLIAARNKEYAKESEAIKKEWAALQWAKQTALDGQWEEEQKLIAKRNKEYADESKRIKKEWAALQWAKRTAAQAQWDHEQDLIKQRNQEYAEESKLIKQEWENLQWAKQTAIDAAWEHEQTILDLRNQEYAEESNLMKQEWENLQWAKQTAIDAAWDYEQSIISERNQEYAEESELIKKEWQALQWAKQTAIDAAWDHEQTIISERNAEYAEESKRMKEEWDNLQWAKQTALDAAWEHEQTILQQRNEEYAAESDLMKEEWDNIQWAKQTAIDAAWEHELEIIRQRNEEYAKESEDMKKEWENLQWAKQTASDAAWDHEQERINRLVEETKKANAVIREEQKAHVAQMNQIGSAIGSGIASIVSGGGVSGAVTAISGGLGIGTSIGAAVGSLGGPIGTAIGTALGPAIDKALGGLFNMGGGASANNKAAKDSQKFFNNIMDAVTTFEMGLGDTTLAIRDFIENQESVAAKMDKIVLNGYGTQEDLNRLAEVQAAELRDYVKNLTNLDGLKGKSSAEIANVLEQFKESTEGFQNLPLWDVGGQIASTIKELETMYQTTLDAEKQAEEDALKATQELTTATQNATEVYEKQLEAQKKVLEEMERDIKGSEGTISVVEKQLEVEEKLLKKMEEEGANTEAQIKKIEILRDQLEFETQKLQENTDLVEAQNKKIDTLNESFDAEIKSLNTLNDNVVIETETLKLNNDYTNSLAVRIESLSNEIQNLTHEIDVLNDRTQLNNTFHIEAIDPQASSEEIRQVLEEMSLAGRFGI